MNSSFPFGAAYSSAGLFSSPHPAAPSSSPPSAAASAFHNHQNVSALIGTRNANSGMNTSNSASSLYGQQHQPGYSYAQHSANTHQHLFDAFADSSRLPSSSITHTNSGTLHQPITRDDTTSATDYLHSQRNYSRSPSQPYPPSSRSPQASSVAQNRVYASQEQYPYVASTRSLASIQSEKTGINNGTATGVVAQYLPQEQHQQQQHGQQSSSEDRTNRTPPFAHALHPTTLDKVRALDYLNLVELLPAVRLQMRMAGDTSSEPYLPPIFVAASPSAPARQSLPDDGTLPDEDLLPREWELAVTYLAALASSLGAETEHVEALNALNSALINHTHREYHHRAIARWHARQRREWVQSGRSAFALDRPSKDHLLELIWEERDRADNLPAYQPRKLDALALAQLQNAFTPGSGMISLQHTQSQQHLDGDLNSNMLVYDQKALQGQRGLSLASFAGKTLNSAEPHDGSSSRSRHKHNVSSATNSLVDSSSRGGSSSIGASATPAAIGSHAQSSGATKRPSTSAGDGGSARLAGTSLTLLPPAALPLSNGTAFNASGLVSGLASAASQPMSADHTLRSPAIISVGADDVGQTPTQSAPLAHSKSAAQGSGKSPSSMFGDGSKAAIAGGLTGSASQASLAGNNSIQRGDNLNFPCFVCGSTHRHEHRTCTAPTLFNGQPAITHRVGTDQKVIFIDTGKTACLDWNMREGCKSTKAHPSHPEDREHRCTLCGSGNHGCHGCPLLRSGNSGAASATMSFSNSGQGVAEHSPSASAGGPGGNHSGFSISSMGGNSNDGKASHAAAVGTGGGDRRRRGGGGGGGGNGLRR